MSFIKKIEDEKKPYEERRKEKGDYIMLKFKYFEEMTEDQAMVATVINRIF